MLALWSWNKADKSSIVHRVLWIQLSITVLQPDLLCHQLHQPTEHIVQIYFPARVKLSHFLQAKTYRLSELIPLCF